jgi:hypothetical protein
MRNSAPPAVLPFYTCARRNQPIILFRGRVDLVGATRNERHRGGIVLDWLPSPTVRCWVRGPASELGPRSGSGTRVNRSRTAAHGSAAVKTTAAGGAPTGFGRLPAPGRRCGDVRLAVAPLHIAKPQLTVRTWRTRWLDRCRTAAVQRRGWTICVIRTGHRLLPRREQGRTGGSGWHTARVQRTSGGTRSPRQPCRGVRISAALPERAALLPVGFDSHDNAVWSRWNPTRTESFTRAATWLDTVHAGEAEALFPAFMARFADPYWREVVIHAVEYLIEAGRPDTLQRAIVMAQILLETLSYSWLVEERALRTHTSFEKHTAAENIRAMLVDMGIPVAMPPKLVALAATRTRTGSLPTTGAGAGAHPQWDHPQAAPRGDGTPRLRSAHRRLAAGRVVLGAGRFAPVRVRGPVPQPAQRQRVDRCGRSSALGAGRAPTGPGACQHRAVATDGASGVSRSSLEATRASSFIRERRGPPVQAAPRV